MDGIIDAEFSTKPAEELLPPPIKYTSLIQTKTCREVSPTWYRSKNDEGATLFFFDFDPRDWTLATGFNGMCTFHVRLTKSVNTVGEFPDKGYSMTVNVASFLENAVVVPLAASRSQYEVVFIMQAWGIAKRAVPQSAQIVVDCPILAPAFSGTGTLLFFIERTWQTISTDLTAYFVPIWSGAETSETDQDAGRGEGAKMVEQARSAHDEG